MLRSVILVKLKRAKTSNYDFFCLFILPQNNVIGKKTCKRVQNQSFIDSEYIINQSNMNKNG